MAATITKIRELCYKSKKQAKKHALELSQKRERQKKLKGKRTIKELLAG